MTTDSNDLAADDTTTLRSDGMRWSPSTGRVFLCIGDQYYPVSVTYSEDLPADAVRLAPETEVDAENERRLRAELDRVNDAYIDVNQRRESAERERDAAMAARDKARAEIEQLRALHHTPYVDAEHQGGNCVDVLMTQSAENARLTAALADTRERVQSLQGLHSTSQETAHKARAELATTREELARWRSGRRQRALPVIESVPDGLQYAAYLARAQGTEGGEEHDTLLRNASMRMKALNDVARQLLAERAAQSGTVTLLWHPSNAPTEEVTPGEHCFIGGIEGTFELRLVPAEAGTVTLPDGLDGLQRNIRLAISDPGSTHRRIEGETVSAWGSRAVMDVLDRAGLLRPVPAEAGDSCGICGERHDAAKDCTVAGYEALEAAEAGDSTADETAPGDRVEFDAGGKTYVGKAMPPREGENAPSWTTVDTGGPLGVFLVPNCDLRPASSVRDTAETAAPRMWRKGDPANERVEWNPAGDTWLPATVVNDWGDDLLILLDENQQHMQVGRKHCRALGDSEPQAAIREMAKRATDHEIEKEKQR